MAADAGDAVGQADGILLSLEVRRASCHPGAKRRICVLASSKRSAQILRVAQDDKPEFQPDLKMPLAHTPGSWRSLGSPRCGWGASPQAQATPFQQLGSDEAYD